MGRKVKQLKNYSTKQVETLIESDVNYRIGVKLYAILQLSRGHSSRELAEFFRTSFKQICNWADRFDAEGITGLHIKPGRGRRFRLTVEQIQQLQGDLMKSPKESGYNFDNWSGQLVGDHIRSVYNVSYTKSAVYSLMRKIGFGFLQQAKSI
jgi:transposase